MPRVLLLLPTSTYRAADFLAAAERMCIDVVAASERPNVMASRHPGRLLTLDFADPRGAAEVVRSYHERFPIDAVIPVDDDTAVAAAAIGAALGLDHNSVESARAARNKRVLVETLTRHGLPAPATTVHAIASNPEGAARESRYPCVLKPLFLSGSRGVIRADTPAAFIAAWRRIASILTEPDVAARGGPDAAEILVQEFTPGVEFALEGLLTRGSLDVLALFDKPDPLDGPFFEETIYLTPSRHPATTQRELAATVSEAATALGLRQGPVHAEMRYNERGAWLLDLAARSIGGLCSRVLRFGTGIALEEIILRHALRLDLSDAVREGRAAGVMMIPIPRRGILREIHGLDAARSVADIEEITISAHLDNLLVPLPEGSSYLGFIFSRADTPAEVEAALRAAAGYLRFEIEPSAAPA